MRNRGFFVRILELASNRLTVRIHCSSGTYIRSLCRDLAEKLGTYAIMTAIKRTRCGSFLAQDAVSIDELTEQRVLSVSEALPEIPRLDLDEQFYVGLCNGQKIKTERSGKYLVFCKNELFGIGNADGSVLTIKPYMREV